MQHVVLEGQSLNCNNCQNSLAARRYILREDYPYCIPCYEARFANRCASCQQPIGTDFRDLSYKDMHWHEGCFNCTDCHSSLVDKMFAHKNDRIYCSECHDQNFAQRCDACHGLFRGGMKKYEFKGKQFHDQCFTCKVCNTRIGTKSFIPRDNDSVCVPCYEQQYAQRCLKCNGVISKGGIIYKEAPWHRECLVCSTCSRQLAGEKFTSQDGKPYCAECFAQLFAKKCSRCNHPITGLGTTKFISFEGRHWHNECFNCYKCMTNLVGRGFLVIGNEVICPDCGRAA